MCEEKICQIRLAKKLWNCSIHMLDPLVTHCLRDRLHLFIIKNLKPYALHSVLMAVYPTIVVHSHIFTNKVCYIVPSSPPACGQILWWRNHPNLLETQLRLYMFLSFGIMHFDRIYSKWHSLSDSWETKGSLIPDICDLSRIWQPHEWRHPKAGKWDRVFSLSQRKGCRLDISVNHPHPCHITSRGRMNDTVQAWTWT